MALLKDLLDEKFIVTGQGDMERDISHIAYHSEKVQKGSLFFALPGHNVDGNQFITDSLKRGAGAVVSSLEPSKLSASLNQTPYFQVTQPRKALATTAATFYGHPSSQMNVIGVTGTNGKTTMTYLLESILKAAGRSPGVIGTINYRYHDKVLNAPHTTPESLDLQEILADMQVNEVTDVIMEVSSHALIMDRVYDCHFNGVIFTNLSQDHLDFHKDMEHYFQAKHKLFDELLKTSQKKSKWCVLNGKDIYAERITRHKGISYLECGEGASAEYWIQEAQCDLRGIQASVSTPHGNLSFQSSLIGAFNIENCLLSIGAAQSMGLANDVITKGLANCQGVPGRLQKVAGMQLFSVFIDYAHTPDALRAVTETLKPLTSGRLIVVFGCGGDRDRDKRLQMGAMATQLSDIAIVTSDNPRTEDPQKIIAEAMKGISKDKECFQITDRRKAIDQAIALAQPQDTILIAGKGHEDYQIIGTKKIDFDDYKVVQECLAGRQTCD
jgi:UDP-N-acetylmuramoyl-L-alanyl-D-glutamate--2,6-diaminopimelate ligase